MENNTLNQTLEKQALYSAKLSRLLAQENIGIEFDSNANTASFRPESRTLTFPYSAAFMDTDIHELFMFHEVAHALFLPANAMDIVKESGVDHELFNIIVDIRDERLIKEKYPGCIKTFRIAYEKLIAQGFFGDQNLLANRSFANRLNVYAKCGMAAASAIKFSPEEMAFYTKCMKAETIQELIDLATVLVELDKDSADAKSIIDYLTSSIEHDAEEMTKEEYMQMIEKKKEEILEERVQQLFEESFKESILNNAHLVQYRSIDRSNVTVTSCKEFVDYFVDRNTQISQNSLAELTADVRQIRADIKQSVNSMVRVFETKKSAETYRNIKISDTGMIDVNKLQRYQFDDKIFRRSAKIPSAKNHAYYIMLDLSGSMSNVFGDVIQQLIVITEFFRQIQVPYKVVGFGQNILFRPSIDQDEYIDTPIPQLMRAIHREDAVLFEVMNSNQTSQQHNLSIAALLIRYGFRLGGTPTMTAMLLAEHDAVEFFTKSKADKKHIVCITDGQPTDIMYSYDSVGKTRVMSDPITRKNFICKGDATYATINLVGKIFEARYGITFSTVSIISSLQERYTVNFISSEISPTMRSEWLRKGFAKVTDPWSKNDIFFAKPFNVDSDLGKIEIENEKKSSAQISRAFLKNLKSVKKSRNFLNALAEKLS